MSRLVLRQMAREERARGRAERRLAKRREKDQGSDSVLVDGTPAPVKRWRVQPEFVIQGPTVVTDEEGIVDIDISAAPSGVTEIRLSIGNLFKTYPFDIDGHRARNPELTHVRFYAPRP